MTSRRKGALDALLDGLGIRLIPVHRRRQAAESHARGTMHELRNSHGEGHLLFVLRLIRQTKGNRDALWSETIGALSDVLIQRPEWQERASDLFDALDTIDLNKMRREAVLRRPWPVRATLRSYLFLALQSRLEAEAYDRDLFGEQAA
jgi:hypothetical protein